MANLQATFAINATLRLTYSTDLQIEETTGDSVDKQRVLRLSDRVRRPSQLTILLGNLQYGQTRDIYLRMKADGNMNPESVEIDASLQYSRMTSTIYNVKAIQSITKFTTLPESEIAYHISRSKICTFLSKIIPVRPDGEHQALISITPVYIEILNDLIANLPAQEFPNDMKNKSLLEDLSGPEPKGQISLALTNSVFYSKWGMHYLPSLLNAHTRQICNTFKDPGPLQYGVDSELFIACRDKLDNAFDNLPAPKPSNRGTSTYSHNFSMASYNTSAGVCFAASTLVHVASGSKVPICSLRKGVIVNTLSGPRLVFAVLKTPVAKEIMCRIGSLLVTPWHPISLDGGKNWKFPAETKSATVVRYTGCVYSILLQAGNTNDSHSLVLDNEICGVTLGHGLLSGPDVRAHPFFGDHAMVLKGLRRIGLERESGLAVGGGVGRDPQTGMVNGFRRGRRIHSIGKNGIRGFRSSRPILHKAVAQE